MAGTWLGDPARGGGILWESGPHYVDLFRYLVGEMKNIYAKGATLAQDIAGTDTVAFMAESVDGVVGTMEGSWSSPIRRNASKSTANAALSLSIS